MSNVVKPYDQESDPITNTADAHTRNAERYAAELIDKLVGPTENLNRDRLVTIIAVAYLEGQCVQLKWARDKVRGDGA